MKGFNASSKKRAPIYTMRLLREPSKVLVDGSTLPPVTVDVKMTH